MPHRDRTHEVAAGRREEVLQTLREAAAPLSIAEIADRIGVHKNTVRFHLDTLVANQRVEQAERAHRVPGRPPQLFQVTTGMDPTGPRHYQLLAQVLVDGLAAEPDPSSKAADAGRAWGRRWAASSGDDETDPARHTDETPDSVTRLTRMLDEFGFAPEQQGDGATAQIGLRHCPFLELAKTSAELVCPIHLGLMQGAMRQWRSTRTVDRLEPFVEPDRCVAHLRGCS